MYFLHQTMRKFSVEIIIDAVTDIPLPHFLAALLLAGLNYLVMIGYDFLGLRYAGSKLSFRRIAAASFIGDSLNANLGLSALAGSMIKTRFYSVWGERVGVVARAIGIYTAGYWMGFATVSSAALLLSLPLELFGDIPKWLRLAGGGAALLPAAGFLILPVKRNGYFRIGRFRIKFPSPKTAWGLLGIGILDWTLASITFAVLMPAGSANEGIEFTFAYLFAHVAAMASQMPGGIAVFESAALLVSSGHTQAKVLASLLVFRCVYFLLPFILALSLWAILEIRKAIATTGAALEKESQC